MIITVTGSRSWRDIGAIRDALWEAAGDALPWNITVRQGCASGADAIARAIAIDIGMEVEDYWPDYAKYSFAEANKLRNIAMLSSPQPDLVLAFPTQTSRGTWHCVTEAKKRDIPFKVIS